MLNKLTASELGTYNPQKNNPQVSLLTPRLLAGNLDINPNLLKQLRKNEIERLDIMEKYLLLEKGCRSVFLANYFGETQAADCGICDHCLKEKKKEKPDAIAYYKPIILNSLKEEKTLSKLESEFRPNEKEVLRDCVRFLLNEEIILSGDGNVLSLASGKKKSRFSL
jgi:ATP-dependent DNA helicase RecQ